MLIPKLFHSGCLISLGESLCGDSPVMPVRQKLVNIKKTTLIKGTRQHPVFVSSIDVNSSSSFFLMGCGDGKVLPAVPVDVAYVGHCSTKSCPGLFPGRVQWFTEYCIIDLFPIEPVHIHGANVIVLIVKRKLHHKYLMSVNKFSQ